MLQFIFSLSSFAYLYQSLIALFAMRPLDAACLTYELYTAHLDSHELHHPEDELYEADPIAFVFAVQKRGRPYKTVVQLYKSIQALIRTLDWICLSFSQQKAVRCLKGILNQIGWRFYSMYDLDIESRKTVYRECLLHLAPGSNEPEEPLAAVNRLLCDIKRSTAI
jgi:hypothetical protein